MSMAWALSWHLARVRGNAPAPAALAMQARATRLGWTAGGGVARFPDGSADTYLDLSKGRVSARAIWRRSPDGPWRAHHCWGAAYGISAFRLTHSELAAWLKVAERHLDPEPEPPRRRRRPRSAGALDPLAHARGSDPETSHDAAELVSAHRAEAMMWCLLVAYHAAGDDGLTAEEASERAGYTADDGPWKRVSDLRAEELIADTGRRRVGSAGRRQMVLVVTDKGREAMRR